MAVRAASITTVSQGFVFALQTASIVVLARLISPRDFGLVTMVTTFSLLLASFGLNGFTEAVLQREEINDTLVSNLWWLNVLAGVFLTLGFAAAGSAMARFFGEPQVSRVAVGMSATILLSSTSVLHLALLKRAMRYTELSLNDIFARGLSVVVSVILAWRGWGYWALVGGAIAQPLSLSVGAWRLCRWIPRFPRRSAGGTLQMVRFAMNIYSHCVANYFSTNLDNLLVGWRFNAHALGFYKKAYDLFVLPASQLLSPVASVVIGALSRMNRDMVQYRRYFLTGLSVLAFVGMGAGAVLTLVGSDMIRLVLGPRWGTAGRIFTFFGPGVGMMLVYGTHGWIHLSIGRADRWFRWGLIEVTVTGAMFLLALKWGPVGIAMAWTASFWVLTVPAFWYALAPIDFQLTPILAAIWRYVVASLLAGCASAVALRHVPALAAAPGVLGAAARIAVTSVLCLLLYVGAVTLLYGGLEPLDQVARLLPDTNLFSIVRRGSH